MNIYWSKAPEWAVAHGLHETGFGIKEFWLGETQHQNLEHEKSFLYGGGDPSSGSFHNSRRESFSYVTQRPSAWDGEGLPPVGTVCEYRAESWPRDQWEVRTLMYASEHHVITKEANGLERRVEGHKAEFRPIRTPEQIAAEEREAGINDIYAMLDNCIRDLRQDAEALWDAGYRKQVAP